MNTFFIKRLYSDVPLMTVETLAYLSGRTLTAIDIQAAETAGMKRVREMCAPKIEMNGDVAIVPVQGVLAYNPDPYEMYFNGVEDSRGVLAMVHQARTDSNTKGVLLRVDTPGGMMLGGPEIGDAVLACGKEKPTIAHVGGIGASLGYLIASQANEVIANRSAVVGSIGVIASVVDWSAYLAQAGVKFEHFTNKDATFKAAGALGTSLNLEQRNNIQAGIESAFAMFKDAVTACRPQVKPEAMRGQTYRGSEAKAVGLVDRVGDESFALGVLRGMINGKQN